MVGAALSLGVFYGCQKEEHITQLRESIQEPTIKPQSVKDWYEKTKNLSVSHFGSDSNTWHLLSSFQPDWSKATPGFSRLNREFYIVPTQSLRVHLGNTKLLATKDSVGNITGSLMVFIADSMYHERKKGYYQPIDFTGMVIYTNLQGQYTSGLRLEDGKIKSTIKFRDLKKSNALGVRCGGTKTVFMDRGFDGVGTYYEVEDPCPNILAPYHGLFQGGSASDSYIYEDYWNTFQPVIGGGFDSGVYGGSQPSNGYDNGGNPSGACIICNGSSNDQESAKMIAMNKYVVSGWFTRSEFDALWADQTLFAQVDGFLTESQNDNEAFKEIKEFLNTSLDGPGYPFEHPVSLAIRNFNKYIFRAFLYSNNFSDIYFHNYAKSQNSLDSYRKAIGVIGEGIMAQKISDESSVISIVTQGSTRGGEQHDILVRVPLYKANGSGTHDLRVHYTYPDGSPVAYTQDLPGDRFKIGRISYEIKTFSDDIDQKYIVAGFVEGVKQVGDRTGILGADAGVLVFDKNAYDIVKNNSDVVAALSRLDGLRDSNNNRKGFLRLETGLRSEVNRALHALIDNIKNINP